MTQVQELLQSIQGIQPESRSKGAASSETKPAETVNFGETVRDFIQAVNQRSKTAAGEVTDVVEGRSEDLAQAMISMEESKLSFQLMLEIRNKLLESYTEIQRMQI